MPSDVEAALARVRIFSSLRRGDLQQLASLCRPRRYEAGETILEEGGPGLGLFVIVSGRVEVFKSQDGRRFPLAVLEAGDVLGEMALLDDQPRSASAAAIEVTECLLVSRDGFRSLVRRRPRIGWPIVPPLVRRIRDLQSQVLERSSESAAQEDPVEVEPAVGELGDDTAMELEAATEPRSIPQADEGAGTAGAGDGTVGADVLRAPYALMMTGAAGFGESIRLFEVFFRSLDEESGLSNGRPMSEVLRELPMSVANASGTSWSRGRRLPSRLLNTFRGHMRSDWRDEE